MRKTTLMNIRQKWQCKKKIVTAWKANQSGTWQFTERKRLTQSSLSTEVQKLESKSMKRWAEEQEAIFQMSSTNLPIELRIIFWA